MCSAGDEIGGGWDQREKGLGDGMKKRTMRRVWGGVMALLIVAGVVGGILWVGRIRGWFPSRDTAVETIYHPLQAAELTGTVLVQRDGISYQLKSGETLQTGDQVTLKGNGTATLSGEDCQIRCGTASAFLVGESSEGTPQLTLTQGELFGRCGKTAALSLVVGNQSARVEAATVDLSVTENALTLDIFSDGVEWTGGDGVQVPGTSGNRLNVSCHDGVWGSPVLQSIDLTDLSDFALTCAGNYSGLCVSAQEIQREVQRREEVAQAALEAELKKNQKQEEVSSEETKPEEPEQSTQPEPVQSDAAEKSEADKAEKAAQAAKAAEEKKQQEAEQKKAAAAKKAAKKKKAQAQKQEEASDKKEQEETTTESGGSCTIRIECSAVLDHMDELKESKRSYVPADGVILKKTKVTFTEGETVYDVLARTCKAAGIQLEVSYSGGYGSYYVEGIGHLYEFDCGRDSGWVYTVNGASPNYGCSSYTLKGGEKIVWSYSCKGLGSDVT